MKNWRGFMAAAAGVVLAALLLTRAVENEYVFFAGYVVLQFVVLATAWNILGGWLRELGSGAFLRRRYTVALMGFAALFLVRSGGRRGHWGDGFRSGRSPCVYGIFFSIYRHRRHLRRR